MKLYQVKKNSLSGVEWFTVKWNDCSWFIGHIGHIGPSVGLSVYQLRVYSYATPHTVWMQGSFKFILAVCTNIEGVRVVRVLIVLNTGSNA